MSDESTNSNERAIERAAAALQERYSTWTWSIDAWREVAKVALEAAGPPRIFRTHLRHPTEEGRALCARLHGIPTLTDDPAAVTCRRCQYDLGTIARAGL